MRPTAWVAAVVAGAVLVAGAALADRAGTASPAEPQQPAARSAVWYCPHGGGPQWRGTLVIANPGPAPVPVRITSLGEGRPTTGDPLQIPPGRTMYRRLEAGSGPATTVVETFDGFVGVGWLLRAGGQQSGLGAEPCLPEAASSWWMTGQSTREGDRARLIVMNPFRAHAVFDIALFTPDAPPLRDPDRTNVRLAPGRSASFDLSTSVPGKDAITAVVEASVGRVAVGSVTTAAEGGLRSAVATPGGSTHRSFPVDAGTGEVVLAIGVPGEDAVRFSVTALGPSSRAPAGGLIGHRQGAASTTAYPLAASDASTFDVTTAADRPVGMGLRATGESPDGAASSGVAAPAVAWVVTPTAAEEPWFPGLVVANPGDEPVTVEVTTLPTTDGGVPAEATFEVGAGTSATPPRSFLESDPTAAILVRATGPVVAAGVSTSSGVRGLAWYVIAAGVPLPEDPAASLATTAAA